MAVQGEGSGINMGRGQDVAERQWQGGRK